MNWTSSCRKGTFPTLQLNTNAGAKPVRHENQHLHRCHNICGRLLALMKQQWIRFCAVPSHRLRSVRKRWTDRKLSGSVSQETDTQQKSGLNGSLLDCWKSESPHEVVTFSFSVYSDFRQETKLNRIWDFLCASLLAFLFCGLGFMTLHTHNYFHSGVEVIVKL